MVGSFLRFAAAAAFSALLAGCSTTANVVPQIDADRGGSITVPDKPISCVPYARAHSNVDIRGDAYTWWDQAAGHFKRSPKPSEGAVMVLTGYSGPEHGHLAVVRQIVSSREIRVDHANWLNNGAIYLNNPVADISPRNDWSLILVWNLETHSWGTHPYSVRGFIGPGGDGGRQHVASRTQDDE
jgi:surface antigen